MGMLKPRVSKSHRIILAGVLATLSFILKESIGYVPLSIACMLISTFVAGAPIAIKAIKALKYWILGIDALVTVAVIGAIAIGEYWEATAVTFLFILGDYLESRTLEKTRSSIKELLSLAPGVARVLRNGVEIEIDPQEAVQGDLVIVRPGEKISVDGEVLEGSGYVNQAAITGESIPVHRTFGEKVFAGTVIESGYLIVRAEKVGEDTSFSRILQMVEDAQDKKAKTQKFLEKFSRYYTPGIIAVSALLFLFMNDLKLALTLLVIACPGALVISAPVAIVAGIGNGAKRGILIKGGDIMEKLGTVKVVAFDKTGTLTNGKPEVVGIFAFGADERELLRLAAIGEAYSEHPLGKAIIRKAKERGCGSTTMPSHATMIPGRGIVFSIGDAQYHIGNMRFFLDRSIDIHEHESYITSEEEKGRTAVLVGNSKDLIGIFSISDTLRKDSEQCVAKLKAMGIKKLVMLTGDNRRAAAEISRKLGLDEYFAELLPNEKVKILQELKEKYGKTAMVGDGVNDAPALASADLGIALGGAGSDVAIETADVVLMSSEIDTLAYAVGLSRITVATMKQNIYFALTVAGVLLAGVLVKTVDLSFGMLIHEASVLLVILNATRLLRYGEKKVTPAREVRV